METLSNMTILGENNNTTCEVNKGCQFDDLGTCWTVYVSVLTSLSGILFILSGTLLLYMRGHKLKSKFAWTMTLCIFL